MGEVGRVPTGLSGSLSLHKSPDNRSRPATGQSQHERAQEKKKIERYERTLFNLQRMYEIEAMNAKQAKRMYESELGGKTELESLLRGTVDEVKLEML